MTIHILTAALAFTLLAACGGGSTPAKDANDEDASGFEEAGDSPTSDPGSTHQSPKSDGSSEDDGETTSTGEDEGADIDPDID